MDFGQIIISLILGGAVFFMVWALFLYPVPVEPPIHRRFAQAMGTGKRRTIFEQRAIAPLLSLALTAAHRFSFAPIRKRIREDLDASGNINGYSVEEYVALCLFIAVSLGLASMVVAVLLLGEFDPTIGLVMAVAGFFLPMLTLHNAAMARLMRITKKLPYTLDLIALLMEAGSNFNEAVSTLIRDEPEDDLNQELHLMQMEMEFGSTRSAALTNMAQRIPLDTIRSIVGAVNQASTLGTPLSIILKSQSGMLRMYRSVRAEKLSASASLRILIPSMLILLAVVLVVFGPVIMRWLPQLMGG